MPDDCDRLNCCPEESLGYEVPKENPNPPGIPTYTLTVDDDIDGGRVEPGTSEYSQNTFATIKAIPDQGYKFKRWDGDVAGSENPASVYMDRNKSVSAVFEPIIHLVTAKTNPVGAGTVNGAGLKAWGSTVEIETVPNSGYVFSHYSGDLNTTNNPADLYVDGDKEIVANLDQITYYNLNILTNPEGAGVPIGAGTYPADTNAKIASNPNPKFCFYSWSGGISSFDDPETVLMDTDKSVTANYINYHCCREYAMVFVLDQAAPTQTLAAVEAIRVLATANLSAAGVVAFGANPITVVPMTTDIDQVMAYLQNAVDVYDSGLYPNPDSTFWYDVQNHAGQDALQSGINIITSYVTTKPKALYLATASYDYISYSGPFTSNVATVNAGLETLDYTWLYIGPPSMINPYAPYRGIYVDQFPATPKVEYGSFPDCTPP